MNYENFSHAIEIDESRRKIIIFRIFEDGKRQLYTEIEFPLNTLEKNKEEYEIFFRLLGENILLDSPVARKIIDI